MADFAALCRGALTVPIYTTLVPEQVRYIIDDSDATIVVVSGAEQWTKDRSRRGPAWPRSAITSPSARRPRRAS